MTRFDWRKYLPRGPWRVVEQVNAADEVPQVIPRNGAVLVGSRERPKWLAFDCPCSTGHRVMIALDPRQWPHWTLEGAGGASGLTLWPSIDCQTPARRCHFFMRRGRVFWIRERSWFHGWA